MKIKLPNFTMTKGKVPDGVGATRLRKLRRNLKSILLWGMAGIFFFLLFAWLSLPTRAIAWRISHEAKARGFIVDIEDVSISPFGGMSLEGVTWTFEPSRPGEIPTKWYVEEVDVDVSVLSLLWGTIDVDIEAELEEGTLQASFTKSSSETSVMVEVAELPLYAIPKARQALNAPLTGLFALKVDVTAPGNKWSDAEGEISINCSACSVGDGEEKLYVPGATSLKNGLVIPPVEIGNLGGKFKVEKGVAETEVPIENDSEDVWVFIEGKIDLKDPFSKSRFEMVLKFNISQKLQDENEPMRFMIQTAKETSKLNAPEKGLGFRLEGPVGKPRFYGINTKSRRELRASKRAQQKAADQKRRARNSRKTARDKKTAEAQDKLDKAGGDDDGSPVGTPMKVEPIGDDGVKPEDPPAEEPTPEEPPAEEPTPEEPPAEEPPAEEPAAGEEGGEDIVIEEGGDEGGGEAPPAEEPPAEGDGGAAPEGGGEEGGDAPPPEGE